MSTIKNLSESHTYEELAAALYEKGLRDGYPKITDKTKWREPVMAGKLNHVAHTKISAGAGKDEYGSDAYDKARGMYAEYKSKALVDKDLNNLFQRPKGKKGKRYATLTVGGVYNGAYKQSALDAYANVDHYFGIFYKEQCVLIIKPNTDEVMKQLTENNAKRKPGATTNLSTVSINLSDTNKYEVAYKKEEFFQQDKMNNALFEE